MSGKDWLDRPHNSAEAMKTLRDVLAAMGDAVIGVDVCHRITLFNDMAETMFGYGRDTIVGRRLDVLIPEDAREGHDQHIKAFAVSPETRRLMGRRSEIRCRRADGTIFPAEASIAKSEAGGQVKYIVAIRNISRRRDAERRLKVLFDEIPIGLALCRMDGSFVDVNPALCRILGRSREDILDLTYWDVTPQRYEKLEQVQLQALKLYGRYGPFEKQYVHRDGHLVPVRLMGALIHSTGEDLIVSSIEDMTSQLRTKEVEQSLANAQRVARMGSWDWNILTGDLWWSDEIYRIFGLVPQAFGATYQAFLDHVHPEDLRAVDEAVQQALSYRGDYSVEHRIVKPGGEVAIVHEQGNVELDETGRPVRMTGTVQDITERREIEQHLRQAQKMEAIGQLTGGIAHDFNNILGIIVGNLDLLESALEGRPMQLEHLRAAVSAAEKGAALTHRLLAIARKQTLAPKACNLKRLIDDTADLLRRTLGGHIDLSIRHSDDLWLCQIDESQLENSIINLALNARDAMPCGGVLSIETSNCGVADLHHADLDLPAGDYVCISVADSGSGMLPEVRMRAFEPFFTTKGPGRGTGLGLSMVYGFVRQSGGQVRIESDPGCGTTIQLYLPRHVQTAGQIVTPAGRQDRGVPPLSILLVEDDAHVLRAVANALETLGHSVICTETAEAALDALRICSPDLLVSDVMLGAGRTGIELAASLTETHPDLPILLISGFTDGSIVGPELTSRGIALLRKPFRLEQLSRAIAARFKWRKAINDS